MDFWFKDVKINYIARLTRQNKKPPIIFLHGWGGGISSFKLFYDKLCELGQDCIAIDFPPFGQSGEPLSAWQVKDYAGLVMELTKNLSVMTFNVVAHSFGARVAIEIASTRKGKIENLLITGGAGIRKRDLKRFLKVRKYKFLKFMSKIKLYNSAKLKNFGSSDYKKLSLVMQKTFVNVVSYDQTKMLKNVEAQTLLVWGDEDKETPFYFTKIFKKNIKNCEVIKFEGCSHFAYLERPNLFFKILCAFFDIDMNFSL